MRRRPGAALVVALEQNALVGLVERAESIGLTPLVECTPRTRSTARVDAGARLIGVNARDLTHAAGRPDTFERIAPLIPDGIVKVAESGVRGPRDLIALRPRRRGRGAGRREPGHRQGAAAAVADLVTAGAHPALAPGAVVTAETGPRRPRPVRPVRRALRPRGARRRAGRADRAYRAARPTRPSRPSSTACCARTAAARRR